MGEPLGEKRRMASDMSKENWWEVKESNFRFILLNMVSGDFKVYNKLTFSCKRLLSKFQLTESVIKKGCQENKPKTKQRK